MSWADELIACLKNIYISEIKELMESGISLEQAKILMKNPELLELYKNYIKKS